jgi:hypothetical protein
MSVIKAGINETSSNFLLRLNFYNRNAGGTIKKFVHYDATSWTLKERFGK